MTERPLSRTSRWIPQSWTARRGDVPTASQLLARVFLLVLLVAIGDRVTVFMTHQGWVLSRDAVVAIRLLASLPIFRYPFEGFVIALEVDKWDWFWLAAGTQSEVAQTTYQEWDKVLDLFPFAVGLVAAWHWGDPVVRRLLVGTFVLRVVGVALFLLTRQGWLMVAFPNVFENLFLMHVVFRLISGHDRMLIGKRSVAAVVLVASVPKLIEEYFIHMLDRRPWDWVNLPVPDAMEPRMWMAAMYLPALVTVVALAWQRGEHTTPDSTVHDRVPSLDG